MKNIKVLGSGCANCKKLEATARKASKRWVSKLKIIK